MTAHNDLNTQEQSCQSALASGSGLVASKQTTASHAAGAQPQETSQSLSSLDNSSKENHQHVNDASLSNQVDSAATSSQNHSATHNHMPPVGVRGSAMPQSQRPPVGVRPAAQGALQYATAWKSKTSEPVQATDRAKTSEQEAHDAALGSAKTSEQKAHDAALGSAAHAAHMAQPVQVFNVRRNVAGLSRLHPHEQASNDADRIEQLQSDLKAFDSFAYHTDDEYNEIIAKARKLAILRHEQVERSEQDGEDQANDERRNADILSSAKELAAAVLKSGLNSKLLDAIDTSSSAFGAHGSMGISDASVKSSVSQGNDGESNEPIAYFASCDQSQSPTCSVVVGKEPTTKPNSEVGVPKSAYDDAFGGDHDGRDKECIDNIQALNPGRDNGSCPNTPDNASVSGDKSQDVQRSKFEEDKNESDVHHEDPAYWAQGGVDAAKSSSLPAEVYVFDGPIQPGKSGITEGESEDEKQSRLERNALESTQFDADHDAVPQMTHASLDTLGGLSYNRVNTQNPFHSRNLYMPCFFLFDHVADKFLADAGSCRLMGLTYTGEWIPADVVRNQLTLLDSEKVFSTLFNDIEGNSITAHVRINQGQHQGERLYITASVVQRDETGIATMLSGYFCQIQSNFMEYLYRIVNHCASYDIDTYAGTISFGYGYQELLGLGVDEPLPSTVQEYIKQYVHPEDLVVYKKQNEVINTANNGDYYESIYRVKHSGGFYLWVIDRGLVVERKRSGKASRIIGTTTNIDVVRSNFERLKRSIYQDPLTGLHNRLYLNTRYKYFTMEESQPLTLCYVDISGLKVINDYLGHAKGDDLVKISATLLRDDVHLDHEVIRLSGDEFLLIFTNCSDIECKLCMNKFACNLDERNRNLEFPLPIYFGFGVATLGEIDDGDTFMRCEARADARLQEYKTIHRERIYANLRVYIENALGHPIDLTDNRRLEYLDDRDDSSTIETPNGARIDDLHKELPSCASQGAVLKEDTKRHSLADDLFGKNEESSVTDDQNEEFSLTIGISDAHEVAVQSSQDTIRELNSALKASARSAQGAIFSRRSFANPNRAEDNDTQKDSLTTLEKKVEETDDVAEYRRALSEFNEQQELSDNASKLVEAYKDKIK